MTDGGAPDSGMANDTVLFRLDGEALVARLAPAREALAGFRFGIILARMSRRSIAYGMHKPPADADDLIMFAPLLEQLLRDLSPHEDLR